MGIELGRLHGLLDEATSFDLGAAELPELSGAFGALRRLQAALDGYAMALAAAVERHTVFPEKQMSEAAAVSLAEAGRIVTRSHAVAEMNASKRCSMTALPSIAPTIRSNANSSSAPMRSSI